VKKKFDAVEIKRRLQKETEEKLSKFSKKEQLDLLKKKFGYLTRKEEVHTN